MKTYTKENITIKNLVSKTSIKPEMQSIAFYGDRTVATDSFRLIEVQADGKRHDPVLYSAKMIQPSLVAKNGFEHGELGLMPVEAVYPDVDFVLKSAFDRKPDMTTVRVDAGLLGETLIAMNKSGARFIELSIPNTPGIALIAETYQSKGAKSQKKVHALVMPISQ